jgi:hypothetical protein
MPNNDIEVFEYLKSNNETPLEIDYLTYAVFAYKKQQWCEHFKTHNNDQPPTQAQIDHWISQLTDYDFDQVRTEAVDFFHLAAEEHLRDRIEKEKKAAIEQSILSEIKEYTSPWRHVLIALGMALVAPIALGGFIFFLSLFDTNFPVHVTFGHEAPTPAAPGDHTNNAATRAK